MLKNKLNWIDFKLEIKNNNFTTVLFENKLNIFWKEIMETKLTENQHIWLLFRLKWDNNEFATIGKLVKLNKEDENYLFEYIMRYMEDKTEYYKEQALKSIIFSYTIRKGLAKEKVNFDNINFKYQNYKDHKLPITMNPLEYGDLIRNIGNVFVVQINKTHLVDITQEENRNIVKLFINAKELYEYIDIKINDTTFERYIDNKKFTFKNGELILLTIDKSTNFIKPLNLDNKLTNKFITLDIETYQNKDGIMIPYCICRYDGVNSYEYKLINYKSSKDMIIDCIKDIMVRKYDNYQVYTHNLSGFDGIFLLKILVELGKVKPLIHNEKIIMIGFKYNNYDITFKDSKQLLLISLRNLAKAFGVETQKSIFPYIEPAHPQEIYNYPDLLTPQFPTHHRVHSYWSSTPPSYHTTDGLNINSCLENAINLDFILWLILFFIFIFIVKYLTFRFWKHVTPYAKQISYL
jgi:DNA polymerase type B, organellar and viral